MAQRHTPYQRRNPAQRQRLYQEASDIFTRETIEDNHRLADMITELQDRNHQLSQRLTHATNDAIEGHLDAEVYRNLFLGLSDENQRLYALFRRIIRENPEVMEQYEADLYNTEIGEGALHANEIIDLTIDD